MATKPIKSVNLLPEFLRTDKNSKFLASTIDQLIQPPQLERIDGFIGSKLTPTFVSTSDIYISESLPLRRNYQLEPALIIKDNLGNVEEVKAIDDLANEIMSEGGINNDFDRLFRSEFYSYDPHIDLDKFVNYQNYYWLPTGPTTISIAGQQQHSTSTYTIQDNEIASAWVFSPNGLTEDPLITLYRGSTYTFDVTSTHKFYIKTAPSLGITDAYNAGVTNNGTSSGTVTIVIDNNTPAILYYTSDDELYTHGQFIIKQPSEDAVIHVDDEIVGKKNYKSGSNISLSNGMKIRFSGSVYPEFYQNKEFFVEGVGKSIRLIDYTTLTSSEIFSTNFDDNFDANDFDAFPYDSFKQLPITPEYITINRASRDLNPWSRYNRWVHSEIIKISAEAEGLIPTYPTNNRARRPIIEFNADLQLFNFGSVGVKNIDLIDNSTLDAFSTVEGSAGFYIDGVLLQQGHRVVFNADTDSSVRGKIYQVNYIIINNNLVLELQEPADHVPEFGASLSTNLGNTSLGKSWWFNGDNWQFAQQHELLNQSPLFDLFDNEGISFSSASYNTNFKGSKIFGYDVGSGTADSILGFPVKFKNSTGVGSFLFKNYFTTDTISIFKNNEVTEISTAITYLKFSNNTHGEFANVWTLAEPYEIPILQLQTPVESTSTIAIIAIDNPAITSFTLDVFVNNVKLPSEFWSTSIVSNQFLINFVNTLTPTDNVLFKIYTKAVANNNGWYETPLGLTNNPLNGSIGSLTLTEVSDHLKTMTERSPDFIGAFSGINNVRDLPSISKYGSRLISNANPIAFSNFFIGIKKHNAVDAISKSADQYNQFKLSFLKKIVEISDQTDPILSVDTALHDINKDKDLNSPWYLSDMVAYGTDKIERSWVVTDTRNTIYPITSDFNPAELSNRSVLVYLNGTQLLLDTDYNFIVNDSSINILTPLTPGDTLVINDYFSTTGSYVPSTPTKLGLYPKFQPSIYVDTTYASGPVNVIQGHDGSITVAYNDYRDAIILELEKRIYNNIKSSYRSELLDINAVLPGAFRNNEYSTAEINQFLQKDFIKWAGFYGIDYIPNVTFDSANPFTWNYTGAFNNVTHTSVSGYWRSFFKNLYDTDRPNSHPWEMLGFSEKPTWWESTYGPAPYTSGNDILWEDLELGMIKHGSRAGIDPMYARPGLINMLPVDESGNIVDPSQGLITNIAPYNIPTSWKFGDFSPAETTWRRSSYWPFAVQRLLALAKPSTYSSLMYDPAHINKNIAGQWTYGSEYKFLNLKNLLVFKDNDTLTSGFSVYVSEIGRQRNSDYVTTLKNDLTYVDFNLFHKVGGFISKNKLQIIIDAIEPNSSSPGALLPQEDYNLILNIGNPVNTIGISGIIVQRHNGKFVIKGYDKFNPFFNIFESRRSVVTPTITVGGVSESFITWTASSTSGANGLSSIDTTTAYSSTSSKFYQAGQLVSYNSKYYRVKTSHQSGNTFDASLFQVLPSLPTNGGATVQIASSFGSTAIPISYGTELDQIQDVYDVIIGYGKWLESQGFIFDEYSTTLETLIDWQLSSKEFLYWTTQNWAENSIITLSPFADKIKFSFPNSVVDNIFDSFYDYSILTANGLPFPQSGLNVNRIDGVCIIDTINTTEGIYFAELNSVQKEHAMVFNNSTVFNDTIYDIETGYRQRRMKLVGFRTSEWNGDYFSPGFIYDTAVISDWKEFVDYNSGDIVRYSSKYYSAIRNIPGAKSFDFNNWDILGSKPVADLLPNFDYKINQFEDFYSLDIDNFDTAQQKMAQHLIGYTPRVYLNNVFTNPIAQYKFYQGYIKEKGTKNAISKLAKASIHNLQGEIDFTEEWAFRVGQYGSYETYQEIEVPLIESSFIENPQILNFVQTKPVLPIDLIHYNLPSDLVITPTDYNASNTFQTTSTNNFQISSAGYVNFEDITATAYNENSLLDIANNGSINNGDVIWLGFKKNGSWDVLRYELSDSRVVGVFVSAPASNITFVTDEFHNLSVGDIISITKFNDQVNGVYAVQSIPKLNQIVVASTLASITNDALLSPGLLFKFTGVRAASFDDLPSDSQMLNAPVDSKFWIDNQTSDNSFDWEVYQKIKNYSGNAITTGYPVSNQQFGFSISKKTDSPLFLVGAPGYTDSKDYGRVFAYNRAGSTSNRKFSFTLNTTNKTYHTAGYPTDFGYTVVYDGNNFDNSNYGLMFVGAPSTSYTISTSPSTGLRSSTGIGATSSLVQEGLVKISSIDPVLVGEVVQYVLLSPNPSSYERFGSSIFVNTGTNKLIIGAPGTITTGSGSVYSYTINSTSTSTALVQTYVGAITTSSVVSGSQWGYSIDGTADMIAIGAPSHSSSTGFVTIFTGTNNTFSQTILSPFGINDRFGEFVKVSNDGTYILISAPNTINDDQSYGKIAVYSKVNNQYELSQVIANPVTNVGMNFGKAIDISDDNSAIVISAIGTNKTIPVTFDNETTTFDASSTYFYNVIDNFGTAYVYNKHKTGSRFVLAEQITPSTGEDLSGTNFGYSVLIDNDVIYAGAPAIGLSNASTLYQFTKSDATTNSLKLYKAHEDLVDVDAIQRVSLFDSFNETIIEHLDIIDPIKGKISGLADEEIKYKSAFDPAIYSIGVAGTVNDTDTNWLDEHVGELWWDLSTVKYVWYEQGSLSYRKNNWGKLFPGATVDVYEWVSSPLLPSEWSSQADTSIGLTSGISGQPKFADNSVISVKQIYNSVSGSFDNQYYYWVKNKVTVPKAKNRRVSSYQTSAIIADPNSYGLKYASVLSKDAITLTNIAPLLVGDRIHLNVSYDNDKNIIPRHTEWLLLQENSRNSMPNVLLEKKLIDSLLGHDSLGNIVPDPILTDRTRYGVSIRPRQTLFKDRKAALRNAIEFTNSVLSTNQITGNFNFSNLEKQELPADEFSHEFDQTVEDNQGLELISTSKLIQAQLSCTVENGKIRSVTIVNPGLGYKISPNVVITNNIDHNAVITTKIDSFGKVISASIDDSGTGFIQAPILSVRPYTVIVLADNAFNGKWTKFTWDVTTNQWARAQTQKFNTTLYWKFIDWISTEYNPFIDYSYTVNQTYQLDSLYGVVEGQYVKVKNIGDGRYVILRKAAPGILGTFGKNYDLMFSQNGTIQILDSIWDTRTNIFGFDNNNNYDQTLYDQTADLELFYILTALKNDLFINELKVNWNLFFFKSVKYALSEQKLLDWAFKTSFINVTNFAGSLDQRPVYKLQNSKFYEDYLKEVKPYHTQIRSFTTNYEILEPTNSFSSDFDLPANFNTATGIFESIELGNPLLQTYPWKSWADNYHFSVGSINVGSPGAGYTYAPQVIITTAPGDTGSGATANAFIRSGEVISIEVTNPGSGYIKTPIVTLQGGGDLTLVPAVVYAQLTNGKVRTNLIGIKFDRISGINGIGNTIAEDTFISNGSLDEYVLNWLATPTKSLITVTLDGELVLSSEYTIVQYESKFNGYNKKYSKIKFLNTVPTIGQLLVVTYPKNINLFNATERIEGYYTATSGMPGMDLPQLMSGIEYPKTKIEGLGFNYTTNWDISYSPFGQSSWADNISYYSTVMVASTATIGSHTIEVSTTSGLVVGQFANIISSLNNKFSTSTVIITSITTNTATSLITFNSTLTDLVVPSDVIEVWTYDAVASILDSTIEAGTWNTLTNSLSGALGINPDDIIIDGDGFITPNTSYGPEELVPGFVNDSIGINVYTRNTDGSPIVFTGSVDVYANTITTRKLSFVPPNKDSIFVTYDNRLFTSSDNTDFTSNMDSSLYHLDWETNQITIGPQTNQGKLGYNIVSIGGGRSSVEAGVIDRGFSVVTDGSTSTYVESLSGIATVKSAYVTVNGVSIPLIDNTSTILGYTLGAVSVENGRAAAHVHNLSTSTIASVQAWFFGTSINYFNEFKEEIFVVNSVSTSTFTLSQPPGNIQPSAANAIVELNVGNGFKKLQPPFISYYQVNNLSIDTFTIDTNITHPSNSFNLQNVRAYVNGNQLTPGIDYTVNETNQTVTIRPGILSFGDAIAILGIPSSGIAAEYDIQGEILTLNDSISNAELRVITFTDHDDMLVRTERFRGSLNRRFTVSRPVFDKHYVWVDINGIPLVNEIDYQLLDDTMTIELSDNFATTYNDTVLITTISSKKLAESVLGYRIFNDAFNRTHFKRLSKKNTTYLTIPLEFTDTEIHVNDSSVLIPPLVSKKIPGVVIIDGERIEFFKVNGNTLTQLRRATLGTSSRQTLPVGTRVIDQSPEQSIPFSENHYKQVLLTTSSVKTYVISTLTQITTTTVANDHFRSDGIVLQTNPTPLFDSVGNPVIVNAVDQVMVYYGGRLLNKAATYYHDTTVAYDSQTFDVLGFTATSELLPTVDVVGSAYVVTSTNHVWVYTASIELDAINGYVYRGLNYVSPEFSINTSTQEITLNIGEDIQDNVRLVIIKKDFDKNTVWNDINGDSSTITLMDSTTIPARFLQSRPSELPDKQYYGR